MSAIKQHDFVEIEYTAAIKGEGIVFDTTDEAEAKKAGLYKAGSKYVPLTVCVGEHFLLKGLDDALVGKEVGKRFDVDIAAEHGFGKKDPKAIHMIPISKFREHNIQPFPGLQLNIDGSVGTVRTVSGGRAMVDFNHPLAGRDLHYSVVVKSVVHDEKRKVESYLMHLGLNNIENKVENGVITISMHHEIPKEIVDQFTKKITSVIPSIKEVKFDVHSHDASGARVPHAAHKPGEPIKATLVKKKKA